MHFLSSRVGKCLSILHGLSEMMKYSVNRHNQSFSAFIIALFALVAFCCLPAVATADDLNADIQAGFDREHAAERAPQSEVKATSSLIERVYEQDTLPVIVRLRDSDLPYGFAPAIVKDRGEIIGNLQSMVLDDISARTAGDATGLNVKRFSTIPAMALHVDASGLEALLAHPDVVEIVEDIPLEPALHDSVELIGGELDGSFETYTGQGQTIAIIDTGVDKHHPFLSGKVVSEACYSTNKEDRGVSSLCPGGAESSTAVNSGLNCDPDISLCGHGTYVAGVAAGSSNKFSGVAKDASIIAIQVYSRFSDCGDYSSPCLKAYSSDVISGLERVYSLRNTYAIASVNMSLGSGRYESVCDNSLYKPVIDTLRAVGIATVVASGNGSSTTSISSPACVASSVSVGSTTKADAVSSFSNSADFLSLLAPGSSITTCAPGAKYGATIGTSIAAPHVAGAWAVLKQAKPDAGVAEVLDALQSTGEQVADRRSGAGNRVTPRIDVQHALSALDKCGDNADCDDGVFCNGVETCLDGACVDGAAACGGPTPVCDEDINECTLPECESDEDCFEGEICSRYMCAEEVVSELMITYKAPVAEKLKKAKKLKLKITGGEGFDPYGDVIVGTFSVLKKKPKVKFKKGILVKNELQVTVLVPAGYPKGTVEVRMDSCKGEINIL